MRSRWSGFIAVAFSLAGCTQPTPPPPPPSTATWSQLFSKLPGAMISVWGTSANEVWSVGAVGGDPKVPDPDGPMVMHYDGKGWTRHVTGHNADLWWVHGFEGGAIFMGGANGAILRYTGGKFEVMTTPQKAGTVFGIWGANADDVWAVGGAGSTPTGGFIWRFDGKAWAPEPSAPKDLDTTATVFKAWGTGPNDVWFVGTQGLILHYDGKAITKVPPLTTQPLFTVHGTAKRAFAVGGDGVILENDGSGWKSAKEDIKRTINGVSARNDDAWAVGSYGGIVRRDASTAWVQEQTGLETLDDFHGVWIDPDGGVWCAGGQLGAAPYTDGRIWYRGKADVAGASFKTLR